MAEAAPPMTVADMEARVIQSMITAVSMGIVLTDEIVMEALRLDLDLPEELFTNRPALCNATCASGKTCTNRVQPGQERCGIHAEQRAQRDGTLCNSPGCKSFAKKWAPLCFSHAKKAGLVPPSEETGECSICYGTLTTTNQKVLGCGHPFHKSCSAAWFRNQTTKGIDKSCPLCRSTTI
jgi:hypothetical protein